MAILVDYNQIFIASLMKQPEIHITGTADEDLVRHMVLNSIRSYRTKFKNEYGELIICCDSNRNWRKSVFPEYKPTVRRVEINLVSIGIVFFKF